MAKPIKYFLLFSLILLTPSVAHSQSKTHTGNEGHPKFIEGKIEFNKSLSKSDVAKNLIKTVLAGKGVSAQDIQTKKLQSIIKKTRIDPLKKNTVIRLSQEINGVPIFGSDVAIHITPENIVEVVSGKIIDYSIDTMLYQVSRH